MMLGKKEILIVLVVLILCCIYFMVEYFVNTYREDNEKKAIVENFQESMMNQRTLDELRGKNRSLFEALSELNNLEKQFFETEVVMTKRFINKKLNMNRIIARKSQAASGSFSTTPAMSMILSSTYHSVFTGLGGLLLEIIQKLEAIDSIIQQVNVANNKSRAIYSLMSEIMTAKKEFYSDRYKYYDENDESYLNQTGLVAILNQRANNSSDINLELINNVRNGLELTEKVSQESLDLIKNKSTEAVEIVNADVDVNKEAKDYLINMFNTQKEISKKMNILTLGFQLPDLIVTLMVVEDLSAKFLNEKTVAIQESNKIASEMVALFNKERDVITKFATFFQKKASFMVDDNQFKYFNTMDKNTKVLSNFCKKIKQVNRPKNNSLLFKRLTREFIKKKNEQMDELNGKIDSIMNEMYVKDSYNQNLYNLRTSEDAQKQVNAIRKAKENIDNMGKLKINIK